MNNSTLLTWFRPKSWRAGKIATTILAFCIDLSTVCAQESGRDTVYQLNPVIVLPTQATERESPVTFSNLNRADLQKQYSTQDVPVLLSQLPSTTFYSENGNGLGYNYINLRGFDQRRLSVMVNGIPQNDPEDHNVYWIDFPDVLSSSSGIQVQRGAGSAFYGPPAIGGSVNLIANPFQRTPNVTLESAMGFQEIGSQNSTLLTTRKFGLSVNSGIVEGKYMMYARLGKITSDGYRERGWVDMNSYFLGAARFDKNSTLRIHLYGGPFTDGLVYTGLPKFAQKDLSLRRRNLSDFGLDSTGNSFSYAVGRRPQEVENFSQPHYEILHDWKISPKLTVANTLFLVTGDGYFDYDASWADTSLLRIGTRYGFPTNVNPGNTLVRGFVSNKQWGWLPRIEIDHGKGMLTLGAELRIHRSTHYGKIAYAESLPANFDPDHHFYEYAGEKDIVSIYGHEMYRLREDLTLMADAQLVYNRYGIKNEKYLHNEFSVPYVFFNPRIGVNYNLNVEWNVYGSLSLTSREPRLRNLYAAEDSYFGATPQFAADTTGGAVRYNFSKPIAKPERLLDLEAGMGFRNAIAHASLNLFWMEFYDELVKSGAVDIFGQPVTGNADHTRHAGIEFDGSIEFGNGFSVGGNSTLSFNRLVASSVISSGARIVLDGNPIAGFPDLLGNVRLSYDDETVSASLSGKYVGKSYTDNFKNEQNTVDPYTVLDATVSTVIRVFAGMEVRIRGEVRNLFNNLYLMSGEGSAFFPAAERNYVVGLSLQL
jgi:iron complex outermembrane receptor protein